MNPGPARRRWRYAPDAAAVVAYCALAFFAYIHLWTSPGPVSVGHTVSDPAGSIWFMGYMRFALAHLHNPLVTAYGNAPFGVNLMDNTAVTAQGFLFAPVTALAGPAVAYVAALTFALASSATAMYVLLRRWTRWKGAAFVGGLLYGFSPYMIGQGAIHLNLASVAVPPLAVLVLHEVLAERRWHPVVLGVVMTALVVVQWFTSVEVLATTAVMCAVGIVLVAAMRWSQIRPVLGRAVQFAAATAVLSAVALAYPLWMMRDGPQHITTTQVPNPQVYRADLLGLIVPSQLQAIAPSSALSVSRHFLDGGVQENGAYLGVTLLVLLAVAVVMLWRRSLLTRMFGCVLAISVVLELGGRLLVSGSPTKNTVSGLRLPEGILNHLPFLSSLIAIRFSLYVAFAAAVLLALLVDHVRQRAASAHAAGSPLLAIAVAVVALVPLIPNLPYPSGRFDDPTYFTTSASVDRIPQGATALVYPFPFWNIDDTAPEVWQAESSMRFKVVGGNLFVPKDPGSPVGSLTQTILDDLWSGTIPPRDPGLRTEILSQLRSWQVSVVLADADGAAGQRGVDYLTWLLGSPPEVAGGVAAWYQVPSGGT